MTAGASNLERGGILGPTHRALTIGVVTLVTMVAFEAMAVTTAMPLVFADLGGISMYAWGFSSFMAATMFGTVVAGDVADRYGTTVAMVAGVVLFAAGLVVAGAATEMAMFLAARLLQGLGGGALVVATYVLAGRAYAEELRPKLMAAISSAWVLPAMIGPLVAGLVSEWWSWRLVFLGLLPFAVASVLVMVPRLRNLPSVPPTARSAGRIWFALAAAVGIALAQQAGQDPGLSSIPVAAVGIGLLAVGLIRLLPTGTLRVAAGAPAIVALRGLMAGAFFGAQAFLPLMLTEHREMTVVRAGIVLTVGSLGWSLGAWWQSRSGLRLSRVGIVRLGTLFGAIGLTAMSAVLIESVPAWLCGVAAVVAGFGMGLTMASLSVLLLAAAPPTEYGSMGAAAQLSGALGQVVTIGAGGVLFAMLHQHLAGGLVFVPIFALMAAAAWLAAGFGRRVQVAT